MKIRELTEIWLARAVQLRAEYEQTDYEHAADDLDKALAELDAKLQDFDAYWRAQYVRGRGRPDPIVVESAIELNERRAVERILAALQIAFEVPTKKPELEKGAR